MRDVNRTYKDSLFRDIFNHANRLPDIYEALIGGKAAPEDIVLATINETLFTGIHNDVSFIVRNQYVLLTEHQSTINKNMPLRLLMYLAETYRRYVDQDAIYKRNLIPLPAPKFYVFYNGEMEMTDRWELRLSDAFDGRKGDMDLTVGVLNINDAPHRPLLDKCHALKSYSVFVAKVREHVKNGSTLEAAVGEAVRYCIANDYLEEYFRQKQQEEVFDMLNFAWDQERALEVRAEEAREDGIKEGLSRGLSQGVLETTLSAIRNMMENLGIPMEKAMDVLQIPPAERAKYAALVKGC